MALTDINWKPGRSDLRKFGLSMIIGFGLIGSLAFSGLWPFGSEHEGIAYVCWIFGALSGLLGLSGTKLAYVVYFPWMGIALVMGTLIGYLLLTATYYLVFTPLGFAMRLFGRDKMQFRNRKADSFWKPVNIDCDSHDYERQF